MRVVEITLRERDGSLRGDQTEGRKGKKIGRKWEMSRRKKKD